MATFGFILCLSVALAGFSMGQVAEDPATRGQVQEVLEAVQGLDTQLVEVLGIVQDLKAENDLIKAKQEAKQEKKAARKASNAGFLDPVKEEKKAAKKAARAAGFENCAQVQEAGNTESGIYTIYPKDGPGVEVKCDLTTEGGGWTVIQRRQDGSVDFDREWGDYVNGFGNVAGEHWLGLDNMRGIVEQDFQFLRVELEDWDGTTGYAVYQKFDIGPAENNYRLTAEGFRGEYTSGEYNGALKNGFDINYHSGGSFVTSDHPDGDPYGLTRQLTGGWWYKYVDHRSNLNGRYHGRDYDIKGGVQWNDFNGQHYISLKKTEMKLRPSVFVPPA